MWSIAQINKELMTLGSAGILQQYLVGNLPKQLICMYDKALGFLVGIWIDLFFILLFKLFRKKLVDINILGE